jgi:hypothetical protein
VAIQGLLPDTNLFVDPSGSWLSKYVPALYRLKPFVLAARDGEKDKVVCLEANSLLISQDNTLKGNKLFTDTNEPSDYFKKIIEFLKNFELSRQATEKAIKTIMTADLFEPWDIKIKLKDKTQDINGFWKINASKLKQLDGTSLSDLNRSNAFDLIYSHFFASDGFYSLSALKYSNAQGANVPTEESLKDRALNKKKAENKKDLDNLVKNLLIEE